MTANKKVFSTAALTPASPKLLDYTPMLGLRHGTTSHWKIALELSESQGRPCSGHALQRCGVSWNSGESLRTKRSKWLEDPGIGIEVLLLLQVFFSVWWASGFWMPFFEEWIRWFIFELLHPASKRYGSGGTLVERSWNPSLATREIPEITGFRHSNRQLRKRQLSCTLVITPCCSNLRQTARGIFTLQGWVKTSRKNGTDEVLHTFTTLIWTDEGFYTQSPQLWTVAGVRTWRIGSEVFKTQETHFLHLSTTTNADCRAIWRTSGLVGLAEKPSGNPS